MKRTLLLLACAAAAASCKDATLPQTPTSIALTLTSIHLDAVGATQSITATVDDENGQPVSNASVTWTSSTSSAMVTPGSATSTATITAESPGVSLVTAIAGSAQTSVVVEVTQVPTTIAKANGDSQSASVSTSLSAPIQVKLTDRLGAPVPGQIVSFTVTGGSGVVAQNSVLTGADGIAATSWTLGSIPGPQRLTAFNATAGTVIFAATALTSAPPSATITPTAGDNQAAMAGTAVPTAPAVRVRDASGSVVAGATVTFTVASGGGTVIGATTTTNANGVATLGSWTLGPTGNLNTLAVSSPSAPTGVATISASGCDGGGGSGFAITVCYTSTMTPTQRGAFEAAAARWSTIITGDLPNVPTSIPAGYCGTNGTGVPSPSLNLTIDDLLIFAAIDDIDGIGEILGQAGPCDIRDGVRGLTDIGSMEFDVADVAGLESSGQLNSVILHEMGHVLGIGTLWDQDGFSLLHNPVGPNTGTLDTYFSGANAIAAFNSIGGSTYTKGLKVPVEDSVAAGAGTYNSHWRESVLKNELMTGWLNSGTNPLSVLTIQSLADIGYSVNPAMADPFTLTLTALRASGDVVGSMIDLRGDSRSGPMYHRNALGQSIRIR